MVVLLFRELFAAKQMVSISFLFFFFKKSKYCTAVYNIHMMPQITKAL